MKYAAIDIGSNAVRLLIADIVENEGNYSAKKNTLLRVPLRLGDDAFLDGRLSSKKEEDLIKTMGAFKNLMDVYKVSDYMACATSAMRESSNAETIRLRIKEETDLDIEVIGGQKEASLIYGIHIVQQLDKNKTYLFIDVGGGSTELSFFNNAAIVASNSFNIGTIRILDNKDTKENWAQMKEWLKVNGAAYRSVTGIGTGGNMNKLFKLSGEKEGSPLPLKQLKTLYNYLTSFSMKERIHQLGLNQDRADVIIPAAEIFLNVCAWSGIAEIMVPKAGLVDGMIQSLIQKNLQPDQAIFLAASSGL